MQRMQSTRPRFPAWPALFVLVILAGLTFAAYWPGLGGPFLLDDWGTLPRLGAYGPVNNLATLVSYLTSGSAGPGGRPLALLSFLIDARNWPAGPWAFKLTNVLLHLVNGVMLALLLRELGRARGLDKRRAAWAAVLGAGLWLAHPLLVSTTLYVVQRMAMLSAFFVIAGLACYVKGRLALAAGRMRAGYALMAGGLAGGCLLGFLSKENAVLLPLLALVLELTVLRPPAPNDEYAGQATRVTRSDTAAVRERTPALAFRVIFLWLPATLVVGYVLWYLRNAGAVVPGRDFSIGERLLTEPRVLLLYLYLLLVPHAWTHGLYTIIPISHGLLQPWTTLPAIAAVLAMVVGAWGLRRRWPVLAAAVLFFFAGHLLESTTLPLELYYEHRNYLPAALLFWPLALWWTGGGGKRVLRYSTMALAFALLLGLTTLRANLWGQPYRLALRWMALNPDSSRAVVFGTDALEAMGHDKLAYGRLRVASEADPDDISIALARVEAACRLRGAEPGDVAALVHAAGHDWTRLHLLYQTLSSDLDRPRHCPGFGIVALGRVTAAAAGNPHFDDNSASRQKIGFLRARLALRHGQDSAALSAMESALKMRVTPAAALHAGAWMLDAGRPRATLALLREYDRLPHQRDTGWTMARAHEMWLEHIGWYADSLRLLRQAAMRALRDDAAPRTAGPTGRDPPRSSRRMR